MARLSVTSRSSNLRDLETRIGQALRETRRSIGWSQTEVAARAGLSSSMVGKVEAGSSNSSLRVVVALADALGIRLDLRVDTPFLADRVRQRDPAHARCIAYCRRRFEAAGWRTASEVEVVGRSRGWIDVVAYEPRGRTLLVVEVKTELLDLGELERQLGRYGREAWTVARRLGWPTSRVVEMVLFLATDANDRRLAANRELLALSFPTRAHDLARSVAHGGAWADRARGLAMIDPYGRRAEWLRAARIDGRRRPAPYLDYADFMRRTRQGRR